jgi:hypothetical protein
MEVIPMPKPLKPSGNHEPEGMADRSKDGLLEQGLSGSTQAAEDVSLGVGGIPQGVVATLHQIAKAVNDSCTDWLTYASRIGALKDAYSLIETLPEEIREPIRSIASTSEALMYQEEIDFDADIEEEGDE